MKNAKLKSIFMIIVISLLLTISAYALTVTLSNPTHNSWVLSNSVLFNFTPDSQSSLTILPWCAIYVNDTGTMKVKANYTNVPNGTAYLPSIGLGDTTSNADYNSTVYCYNNSDVVNSSIISFGVDGSIPSVILDSPAYGAYIASAGVNLSYTPTDSKNLLACHLYHNLTGTWHLNETNASVSTGKQDVNSLSPANDGRYIWNVYCNDTGGNIKWAEDANRTFIIDTTSPTAIKFLSPKNNSFSNNKYPYIVWNVSSDANFQKYTVRVSNSSGFGYEVQSVDITSSTSNYTNLSNLVNDGVYYIRVSAYDLAGNVVNATHWVYTLDTTSPILTLNGPADGSYISDNTPAFNVTVVDNNPNVCILYLSNSSGGNIVINATNTSISNNTPAWFNVSTMTDGFYKFNIECNDSKNIKVNISATNFNVTIDTVSPTAPNITINWGRTNNTDKTPLMSWVVVNETNFERYLAQAFYRDNGTTRYGVNVTTRETNYVSMSLTAGYTYNFSVTAYDLAGNLATSHNTTTTWYYVDPVCGTLNAGWNLCGATWTTPKNLTVIGTETSATFVTAWVTLNHSWATCIYGISTNNCNLNVSISQDQSMSHAVWIYVNSSTEWRNRTWVATQASANITLSNYTNRWNLEAGFFRNGRTFGYLGDQFTTANVSMFSMNYNNGTSVPFVNKVTYRFLNNLTNLDYGRGMWIYYNGTVQTNATWDIGGW